MAEIEIVPGIFEKDWTAFVQKVALAAPYVPWVHTDILDNTMVAGKTVSDFSKLPELKGSYPNVSFEAHLMVGNPEKYVRELVDSGFDRLIAHVEANDPRRFLEAAKFEEVEVGLALDGTTEVEVIEPLLEEVAFVVVLTAEAGAPDRPFLPEAAEKVKLIRENYPDLPIEALGGITPENVKTVKDAGATRIVSTHFIFNDPQNVAAAIEALKAA